MNGPFETCDVAVPPDAPWGESGKDPMEGNVTLPFLWATGWVLRRSDE
jgi:hypothetical protein